MQNQIMQNQLKYKMYSCDKYTHKDNNIYIS